MKNILQSLCLALSSLLACSCMMAGPGQEGLLYNDTTVPNYPAPVAGDGVVGTRSGEGTATAHSILGLFAWGDAGVAAAAKNGGVTQIKTVDVKKSSILGFLYSTTTTKVTGPTSTPAQGVKRTNPSYQPPLGVD